jgi:hydroxymethylpyrimidine pyrophosphatase-like HAD family hydrolase
MTYFIDLDGTILNYHKNKLLHGAKVMIRTLRKRGHMIVFITQRGPQDDDKEWNMVDTKRYLEDMGMGDIPVAFGVQPGRVLVDDTAGAYVYHKQNRHWDDRNIHDLLKPTGM